MNVYDFDWTIYHGESCVDFFMYCLRRNRRIIPLIPITVWGLARLWLIARFKLQSLNIEKSLTDYCRFFKVTDNMDKYIDEFWSKYNNKIKKWYIEQKDENDIIISSAPTFLLEPICEKLGIKYLIATNIDKKTGTIDNKACFNKEKVIRIREAFPDIEISNFYSDSIIDKPLMEISKNSFIVKGNKILEYKKRS
jgi:phosphoserine phosphatase